MQHATQVELLRKALALAEQGVSDCLETASSLAVDSYLDEARHRRERDEVLRREPVLVARSSEVAAGRFITRDLLAPLLLVRDEAGRLRGFQRLQAPWHAVGGGGGRPQPGLRLPLPRLGLQPGRAVARHPHGYGFEGVERGCLNLTEVPVAECFGAIWARHSPGPALTCRRSSAPS